MNTRLDELQAAILRVKLRHLGRENARRQQLARLYDAALAATPLGLPQVRGPVNHVYHQYVVRSPHREDLQAFLRAGDIGTAVHYPVPVHLQPAYHARLAPEEGGLRQTEQVCREVLSLPMHPQMTDEQAARVGAHIVRWHEQTGGSCR
jgi:dTDP-4-amino-4,6-dideoxygalactose transaminase